MLGKPALQPSRQQLFGPAQHPLEFRCHLTHEGKEGSPPASLCSKPPPDQSTMPSPTLQLAARMDSCETTLPGWERIFPKVFEEHWQEITISNSNLMPDCLPSSLHDTFPSPFAQKLPRSWRKWKSAGIISKVTEPTPWCAGMVVVFKKSGSIRICVDLKPLNLSVLREVHPLPKVDETLAQDIGTIMDSEQCYSSQSTVHGGQ